MAKPDLVKVKAAAVANTTVRGPTARYNVYTNPDDPAAAEIEVERGIARQLRKAGAIEAFEDDDAAAREAEQALEDDDTAGPGTGRRGGTIEHHAARRRRVGTEGDNETDGVSGADTRDTTAFANNPLTGGGNVHRAGAGGTALAPDADAPPAGGEGVDADAGGTGTGGAAEAAPKPKRRRTRGKAKAAEAPAS